MSMPAGLLLLLLVASLDAASGADLAAVVYPAPPQKGRPGAARAVRDEDGNAATLENNALQLRMQLKASASGLRRLSAELIHPGLGKTFELPTEAFTVTDALNDVVRASDMIAGPNGFHLERIEADSNGSRYAEKETGWRIKLPLRHPAGSMNAVWSVELRDNAGYVRMSTELMPQGKALELRELALFDGALPHVQRAGSEVGVPLASEELILGYEHPQATNDVRSPTGTPHAYCALKQDKVVEVGDTFAGSLVLVVSPERSQLRRAFLHYLERERAHPTRPMLHYNSWYDIGTGLQFRAEEALGRLREIATQLSKRGLQLDSFLLDDGWDDPDNGPWARHTGFDDASFKDLEAEATRWGTGLGVWFSPFGGYHEPRQRRLVAARKAGLPIREELKDRIKAVDLGNGVCSVDSPCDVGQGDCNDDKECKDGLICWQKESKAMPPGLDTSEIQDASRDFCVDTRVHSGFLGLGIPEYYDHFVGVVQSWLQGGARLLKLDGIGNPAGHDHTTAEDFNAAVSLMAELRKISKDVFINLSTGTWPSPFWLLSSDTVWRRGHDHYFAGQGNARERWITYRDAMVYRNVVQQSPMFPLNSLMVHGVIYAKDAWDLNRPEGAGDGLSGEAFRHEVRSAFGSGAMLQELYITPSLLSRENWDDLALAASWVRPQMPTLADTNWFGADPESGGVYGWAAWRDAEDAGGQASAVLTLRNAGSEWQTVALDAASLFALPRHAQGYPITLNTPFADQRPRQLLLVPNAQVSLRVPPFAVLVFDTASPAAAWYLLWLDTAQDAAPVIFWSLVAVGVFFAWQRSTVGGPSPAPVSSVDLRKRREAHLAGLEKQLKQPADGEAGHPGLRERPPSRIVG
eukprot:TRINITY_DN51005_c0_g1_i1.p1 TRINITY_DN51005_c0_g1~~TRINITY_DN51005_c0_g1_i1.p1  ORF type:complete len:894 (+),score=168.70 TRINITY_DN51005_c0_g1_i1:95-2683(+)